MITDLSLPVVSVSAFPEVLIESEGTVLTLEFKVIGTLPSNGLPVRLIRAGEVLGSNIFLPFLDYQQASLAGAKDLQLSYFSVPPAYAGEFYKQLTVTLTSNYATVSIPIASDGLDQDPTTFRFGLAAVGNSSAYSIDPINNFFQFTVLDTRPNLDRKPFNSISGSDLNDVLLGTANRDVINGGLGNDTLEGLDGDDILMGGAGIDRLLGGNGNDILIAGNRNNQSPKNAEILQGGPGADIYVIRPGDQYRVGEVSQISRQFEVGKDKLAILRDEIDPKALTYRDHGGFGSPYVIVSDLNSNVSVEFSALGSGLGDNTTLQPKDILEMIIRPIGDVVLGANEGGQFLGSELNDEIYGSGGSDRMVGFDGDDLMVGGAGFDRIAGGDGRDIIIGGSGTFIRGGAGADVFVVRPSSTRPIFISDFNGKEDRIGFIHGEIAPNDLAFQVSNGATTRSGVYQISTGNLLAIISNASTLPDLTQTSGMTVLVSASLPI